jgi:hypothetical protein
MTRSPVVAAAALVAAALTGGACTGGDRAATAQLPTAEFLFAAGDSTYWVRSGPEGMRVRSAPILLTQVDRVLYEVFLTDDGAEYPEASFATSRLWARALTGVDSVSLFADSTVMQALAAWRRQHPREAEIDPADEDAPDDPATVVQDELDLIDVHGPYLSFEHLLNVDIDGGPPHQHAGRRYVVDVRTGVRPTLAELLGGAEAMRVLRDAQRTLRQLTDSIRRAGATGDARAEAAIETLDSFRFDSASFGLTDVDRQPAVAFLVPGFSTEGEALALNLPPIVVAPPAWWPAVASTLPQWAPDSSLVRWPRGRYEVLARPSATSEALALLLSDTTGGRSRREWPVATVVPPAYQVIPLEPPALDSAGRAALGRAFDASTALDGLMEQAVRPHPQTNFLTVGHGGVSISRPHGARALPRRARHP